MKHTTKQAVAVTQDQGDFTAIAAAYTVDRAKDEIAYGAFKNAIAKWKSSGKMIPLHWNHSGEASDIIGTVDPAQVREVRGKGLVVAGHVDLSSETAQEAWRAMKSGAMSLSFGYMVLKASQRSDGVQVLEELDLFEVSIVPIPANPDTRVLSMKALQDVLTPLSAEELKLEMDARERAEEEDRIPDVPVAPPEVPAADPPEEKRAPRPLDELKRLTERRERAEEERTIPDVPEVPAVVPPEPPEPPKVKREPRPLADLKAAMDRRARAEEERTIPVVEEPPEVVVVEKSAEVLALEAELADAQARIKALEDAPTAEDLAAQARRREREAEEARIPRVPSPDLPLSTDVKSTEVLTQELQEARDDIAQLRGLVAELQEAAAAVKALNEASTVDPLRRRADEAALKHLSGGLIHSKPIPVPERKEPEPSLDLDELRDRMREGMLSTYR